MACIKSMSLAVALGVGLNAPALAGDCFNDDGAVRDDLEPAVLKISDADIDALRLSIRAHEQRMRAAREAAVTATARPDAPSGDANS